MTRTLLRLIPTSVVARALLTVAAVIAALILCLHYGEGPEGRADAPLAQLWVPAAGVAMAVLVELVTRAYTRSAARKAARRIP